MTSLNNLNKIFRAPDVQKAVDKLIELATQFGLSLTSIDFLRNILFGYIEGYLDGATCSKCTTPDAIISGDYKPISQISVGESVLSRSGHTEVTETFKRNYKGKLIQIKGAGCLPVNLTPEHPVLVTTGVLDIGVQNGVKYRRRVLSKPYWKEAKDIVPKRKLVDRKGYVLGDYLLIPRIKGEIDIKEIDISTFTTKRGVRTIEGLNTVSNDINTCLRCKLKESGLSVGQLSKVTGIKKSLLKRYFREKGWSKPPKDIWDTLKPVLNLDDYEAHVTYKERVPTRYPLNKETSWLLGIYVAEGCTSKTELKFCFGKHEKDLIEKTCSIISNLGYTPNTYERKSVTTVCIQSRVLARAFSEWCGKGAHNKRVPEFILYHKDLELLRAFLHGYFDGDGSYYERPDRRRPTISAATVSRTLALQLQLLCARLGYFLRIHRREVKDSSIEGRRVKGGTAYYLDVTPDPYKSSYFILNDYIATPVREIDIVPYEGDVFNLETRDNAYTIHNIIVHNCFARIGNAKDVPDFTYCPECNEKVGVIKVTPLRMYLAIANNADLFEVIPDRIKANPEVLEPVKRFGNIALRFYDAVTIEMIFEPLIAWLKDKRPDLYYTLAFYPTMPKYVQLLYELEMDKLGKDDLKKLGEELGLEHNPKPEELKDVVIQGLELALDRRSEYYILSDSNFIKRVNTEEEAREWIRENISKYPSLSYIKVKGASTYALKQFAIMLDNLKNKLRRVLAEAVS